jgi:hypothetical protein
MHDIAMRSYSLNDSNLARASRLHPRAPPASSGAAASTPNAHHRGQSGHRDFVIATRNRALQLRYLVRHCVNELVLKNFAKIVEMHQGEVACTSGGSGQGYTYKIWLPLVDHGTETVPEAQPRKIAARRVLIIDDNHDAADSLATM